MTEMKWNSSIDGKYAIRKSINNTVLTVIKIFQSQYIYILKQFCNILNYNSLCKGRAIRWKRGWSLWKREKMHRGWENNSTHKQTWTVSKTSDLHYRSDLFKKWISTKLSCISNRDTKRECSQRAFLHQFGCCNKCYA